MNTIKPKSFKCSNCQREYYVDSDKCGHCGHIDSILPIPVDTYMVYINDILCGGGDLKQTHTIVMEYIINRKMHGKSKVRVEIIKCDATKLGERSE